MNRIVSAVVLVLLPLLATGGAAQEQGLTEVAAAAAALKRKAVVAERMQLSEDEGRAFWPIYNDYLARHEELSKQLASLVQQLAREFETLDDRTAGKLLEDYHEFREDRLALRWRTVKKLKKKKLGERRISRFYQIENKLDTLMDLELVKNVPLVDGAR